MATQDITISGQREQRYPLPEKHRAAAEEWGITPETASYFGLEFHDSSHIKYPSQDGSRARLARISGNGHKYMWHPKEQKKKKPVFYHHAGLIASAGQRLIVANGEKAVWALHTAGYPNSISLFGEDNKIDDLVSSILSTPEPPKEVAIYPDIDDAGYQAARKWESQRNRLQSAGIDLIIYDMGAYLKNGYGLVEEVIKWDLRDIWLKIAVQDPVEFAAILSELEGYPMTGLASSSAKPEILQFPTPSDGLYEQWKQQVVFPRLPEKALKGKHVHCPNPAHEDKNPSFRIGDKGSPQCTCDPQNFDEVATWLGLPSYEDWKQERRNGNMQPGTGPTLDAAPLPTESPRFQLIPEAELDHQEPVDWLIQDYIPRGEMVTLYGQSGTGKSFIALDMAFEVGQLDSVVYVASEGQAGYPKRRDAWYMHHNLNSGKTHFLYDAVSLMNGHIVDEFIAAIRPLRPALVVFDTLAYAISGGDENSAKDMQIVISNCQRIIRETGAAVLLVHHTGKSGVSERGSSALRGASYVMIQITNRDGHITLECTKTKDESEFDARHFRLMQVDTPHGQSCVVMPSDKVIDDPNTLTPTQRKVLETLSMATFREAGAKAAIIADDCNISRSHIYKILSPLMERDLVHQGSKGEPFTITAAGLLKIAKNETKTGDFPRKVS